MGYDIACYVDITNRKGVRHEELWVSFNTWVYNYERIFRCRKRRRSETYYQHMIGIGVLDNVRID